MASEVGSQSRQTIDARRRHDPPLSVRDCATWMGVSPNFVRDMIQDGKLHAERVEVGGKRAFYRIHLDKFNAFLRSIGWSRLPRSSSSDGLQ